MKKKNRSIERVAAVAGVVFFSVYHLFFCIIFITFIQSTRMRYFIIDEDESCDDQSCLYLSAMLQYVYQNTIYSIRCLHCHYHYHCHCTLELFCMEMLYFFLSLYKFKLKNCSEKKEIDMHKQWFDKESSKRKSEHEGEHQNRRIYTTNK